VTDPLLRLLAELAEAEPDRVRAQRVRARCHGALARGRPAPRSRAGARPRLLRALLAGLATAYLLEAVRLSLTLVGIA
jgi:hypothetical protein